MRVRSAQRTEEEHVFLEMLLPVPCLPQEYECLEQENTVLRREIGKLTEELKHLSEALKEHEKMCPLLLCPMNFVPVPRPDAVAGCLPR